MLRVDVETGTIEHIAKGLRNPQGIDRDVNGAVLVTDHGMRGGDELNIVRDGANFGFPVVTLGTKYSSAPGGIRGVHGGHDGFAKPLVAFVPSIAPSSVLTIRDFHPNWDGDLLVGGLRRQLHRVYREDGAVLFVEPIDVGARVRDMTRMKDGRIAILSDDNKIVLVEPGPRSVRLAAFQSLLSEEPDPDLRTASRTVFDACLQCHGIEAHDTGARPSLYGVCGRPPGSDSAAGYSGVLPRDIKIWDQDKLVQFISDPGTTAPGTTMAWDGLDRQDVARVIARTLCQMDPVP